MMAMMIKIMSVAIFVVIFWCCCRYGQWGYAQYPHEKMHENNNDTNNYDKYSTYHHQYECFYYIYYYIYAQYPPKKMHESWLHFFN